MAVPGSGPGPVSAGAVPGTGARPGPGSGAAATPIPGGNGRGEKWRVEDANKVVPLVVLEFKIRYSVGFLIVKQYEHKDFITGTQLNWVHR